MRVYIMDCPSPLEILVDKSEHKPLERLCKSMNHEVYTFHVKSKRELREICQYIGSIDKVQRDENEDKPICIHISAHGDKDGLQFGKDAVDWDHVLDVIKPILKMDYSKEIILVISSCGTDNQRITNEITKLRKDDPSIKPPQYVIVFDQAETSWKDAVLAWTIFYHQVDNLDSHIHSLRTLYQGFLAEICVKTLYMLWQTPLRLLKGGCANPLALIKVAKLYQNHRG